MGHHVTLSLNLRRVDLTYPTCLVCIFVTLLSFRDQWQFITEGTAVGVCRRLFTIMTSP